MEGGPHKANKTEFTECWRAIWRTPYIMLLAMSAGIGGFLFGYDTGVISGALLYIRDDFEAVEKHTWLQASAVVGAGLGGWLNDKLGRRKSIIIADVLFFIGAVVMASAPAPANGLLLTGGQFLSYLINLAFTRVPGTWRWMLGIAGVPALVQFILMFFLPESPRWLYRQNKVDEARAILERLYSADEVEQEMSALKESVEHEKAESKAIGDSLAAKLKSAWGNTVVRRGLYAGITVQVAQQFVGINTVMYYSPTIVQLAGFASNRTAIALSIITSALNAAGTVVSMLLVDRFGRRKLIIYSMLGTITCLVVLSVLFQQASVHSPPVSVFESNHFGVNTTCPSFLKASNPASWSCIGTVPWIVNSEIYPLRYRGIGGGIAAVSNWLSNLVVSQTFLTLTEALGPWGTFLLFAGFAVIGLIAIFFLVPETKGLPFEEVEKMLEKGFKPKIFSWNKSKDSKDTAPPPS
nr:inositol transporter 4-like [Ipomoea batatas]